MISLHSGEFLELTIKELMISSERVAHVQIGNNLEHALLSINEKRLYGDSSIRSAI